MNKLENGALRITGSTALRKRLRFIPKVHSWLVDGSVKRDRNCNIVNDATRVEAVVALTLYGQRVRVRIPYPCLYRGVAVREW